MKECPKCGNRKIKECGGMEIGYERSVSTGKMLKKEKDGKAIWYQFYCTKCSWISDTFIE